MTKHLSEVDLSRGTPRYAGWRGELLAELNLRRVPGLVLHKQPANGPFDFLASTPAGVCFYVEVRAFSSMALHLDHVEEIEEWTYSVSAQLIQKAHRMKSPVLLLLFDADLESGRFLRLDLLPHRSASNPKLHLPRSATIAPATLHALIQTLEREYRRDHRSPA